MHIACISFDAPQFSCPLQNGLFPVPSHLLPLRQQGDPILGGSCYCCQTWSSLVLTSPVGPQSPCQICILRQQVHTRAPKPKVQSSMQWLLQNADLPASMVTANGETDRQHATLAPSVATWQAISPAVFWMLGSRFTYLALGSSGSAPTRSSSGVAASLIPARGGEGRVKSTVQAQPGAAAVNCV